VKSRILWIILQLKPSCVLACAGYSWLEAPAFEVLCKAFDPQRDGKFGLTEFIAIMAFLKSARATFLGFSQGNDKATISLTLNQFVYAAAFTR